jgi:hypothetical protein
MNIKILKISFLLALSSTAWSFDETQTVKIGPLSLNLKYCEQVDKVSSIVNSFSNVKWPVTGAPGVTMGIMQRSSVIIEFCDYLMRLKSLSTEDGIWASADYLNKLTGNKWDDHLSFARSTYDMKDVFIDSSGKGRKLATLANAGTASRLNSYYKESSDYYDNHLADPNSKLNVRNRQQMEGDLSQMASLSNRQAILKDIVNCPDPTAVSSKISDEAQAKYDSFVAPANTSIEKLTADLEFYSQALRSMGVKISRDEKELSAYLDALKSLESKSISFNSTATKMQKESLVKSKNPSKAKGAPKTIEKKTMIDYNYKVFGTDATGNFLDAFKKRYVADWKSWTTSQVVQNTYGLLDGPTKRVEDEFKDTDILCPPSKYLQDLAANSSQEEYEKFKAAKKAECLQQENKKIGDSGGLLGFYADKIFDTTKNLKAAQSSVWSYESKYLDIQRSVTGSNLSTVPNQSVSCGELSSVTALANIGNQMSAVGLEIEQKNLEIAVKLSIEQERQDSSAKQRQDESERKKLLEIEADKKVAPEMISSGVSKAKL